MAEKQNGGRWWLGMAVSIVVLVISAAMAWGSLVTRYELDKRVTVLEELLPRIESANNEAHATILKSLEKIDSKLK